MTTGDFERALAFTLGEEGGTANHPRDHGGLTSRGLTQRSYDSFREVRQLPLRPVTKATDEEIQVAARQSYWQPAGCDHLAWPASAAHFDFAYNAGLAHATLVLQAVLSVKTDGVVGPITIAVANQRVPAMLAHDLVSARRGYHTKALVDDPTQLAFIKGWIARCDALDRFVAKAPPGE